MSRSTSRSGTEAAGEALGTQASHPASPHAAEADDVAAFLTHLAVTGRAAPSTQKQALNALVFLMQEALHRQLGEIEFRRAAPRQRMPVVLTKEECARLFAECAL